MRIQVKPGSNGLVTDGFKLSAHPFDDIGLLEEALRLRVKGVATKVIMVAIGPADLTATCATAWRRAQTVRSTSSPLTPCSR